VKPQRGTSPRILGTSIPSGDLIPISAFPVNNSSRSSITLLLVLYVALSCGCGYHVAGKASAIPQNIDSIAIPIFVSRVPKYRLEQRLTAAVVDEFIARTHYRVTDASSAKSLLSGEVTEFRADPVLFAGGAGSTFLVTVRMRISLKDLSTNKLLFENNNFYFREEFQISPDFREFFPEEGPALDRLAKEFSRTLVSTILESF
jgi:Lipopolysaccharide-assembly